MWPGPRDLALSGQHSTIRVKTCTATRTRLYRACEPRLDAVLAQRDLC
jgi:hypothetical protein